MHVKKKKVVNKYKTKANGKNDTGRPIERPYNPNKTPRRVFLLYLAGFTNKQVHEALEISARTFHIWRTEHPEFVTAIKEGKDAHDSGLVESALLQRALGFEYTEVSTESSIIKQTVTVDGKSVKVRTPSTKTKTTNKKVLADVTAIMYWLNNRHSDRWKNIKHLKNELSGEVITKPFDFENLKKRELELLRDFIGRTETENVTIH